MATRGGCVIDLHLHLGNSAVGTHSFLLLLPVPVWRRFPEGTSGVSPGGTGTCYPTTDQGTRHRNLRLGVIMLFYFFLSDLYPMLYKDLFLPNCKRTICSFHKPSSCVCLPVVTKRTSRSTGSNRATRPTGETGPNLYY